MENAQGSTLFAVCFPLLEEEECKKNDYTNQLEACFIDHNRSTVFVASMFEGYKVQRLHVGEDVSGSTVFVACMFEGYKYKVQRLHVGEHVSAVRPKAPDRPDLDKYKDNITDLLREFERRFQVFSELENKFGFFRSPFTVKPSGVPADIQFELIDLQCDSAMKDTFGSVGLDTFYQYLVPGYPKLTAMAAKVLSMFETTYLCEQVFSVMNNNKTKQRSKLTNEHLNDIVKCAATQDLTPDIDALVKAKNAKFQEPAAASRLQECSEREKKV
ncbi:EPM2A-interacting protein 1-like isoform 2-T2 [Syngnathus typhle]